MNYHDFPYTYSTFPESGAVGSGKTSLLWSMLNDTNGLFMNYFDKIVMWSSTIDSDGEVNYYRCRKRVFFHS